MLTKHVQMPNGPLWDPYLLVCIRFGVHSAYCGSSAPYFLRGFWGSASQLIPELIAAQASRDRSLLAERAV